MFRLTRLLALLEQALGFDSHFRGIQGRGAPVRRRALLEPLEDRLLLSTTVFLDFGAGIGMGNTMDTTAAAYRDIFGAGTGTNLTDDGLAGADTLRFTPLNYDFDLDFDSDSLDTRPPEPREPGKRALIASADRNERLYLRAKLALAELTVADEAETGAQALELARAHQYAVALVDFALPDVNGWALGGVTLLDAGSRSA